MQISFAEGGYTAIPPANNVVQKLQKRLLASKKYKKLVDAGYVPEFSLKDDLSAIVVRPATCINGHPLYNGTHLCLSYGCIGSKRIVYAD